MTKPEIVDLVVQLSNNVDEADQFSYYIPEILSHCDKKFLIELGNRLADTIEQNGKISPGEFCVDNPAEIDMMTRLIRKLGKRDLQEKQ